jgi:hypothetical protein
MDPPVKRKILFAAIIGLLTLVGVVQVIWWLKAPYPQTEARLLAQSFLDLLRAGEFEKAHELTLKNGYVGKTPKELEEIARKELCPLTELVGTFPFQSNGNRIRRWLSGREVEMPELHVEFAGSGLLGVNVRRTKTSQWKVFRFAGHAG